jgi:predicted DsbA family dithiol-disulfide isomerase
VEDELVKVDIWSDVVCPWCYVGKRRFEAAVAEFDHGDDIEVEWHSFELDPTSPHEHQGDMASRLSRKYGMSIDQAVAANDRLTRVAAEDGIEMRFDRARSGNTFDAHRLIHLAHDRGVQDAVKERLMLAYFTEGELISDHDTLVRVVAEAGLDADDARAVLDGDAYADAVRADEETAMELGITGVPFFVVDHKFGISGAQPVDTIVSVLDRAWAKAHPIEVLAGGGSADGTCDDGSCAI